MIFKVLSVSICANLCSIFWVAPNNKLTFDNNRLLVVCLQAQIYNKYTDTS